MTTLSSPAAEPAGGTADTVAFLADLRACVGQRVGASDWVRVDQARIDRFAEATGDRQFVHVDPVRAAAETPFGGTVAHGYLTLAMLGGAAGEALPGHPCIRAVLNLGADKVRFLAPVHVDSLVRGVFVLRGVNVLPEGRAALRLAASVEVRERMGSCETLDTCEDGEATCVALSADLTLMLILDETQSTPTAS